MSKRKKWFLKIRSAILVFLASLAGTLALLFLVYGTAALLRGWFSNLLRERLISNLQNQPQAQIPAPAPPGNATAAQPPAPTSPLQKITQFLFPSAAPAEELTGSSFTDLFSGTGWINQGETTLYQDRLVTAFLFPPAFTWENATPPPPGAPPFIARGSDGGDERCVSGHCLKQRGLTLTYDGGAVQLPSELRRENVVELSLGAVQTFWLVGATVERNGSYEGVAFSYQNGRFTKIFPAQDGYNPFVSSYRGVLGFGGDDGDWLAVYGAYEGKAVRVRGASYTDISRFFGIRVMNGGFEAVVTRTPVGWYVWSMTDGNPKLVKLFENGTGEIQGATDLSPQLFEAGTVVRASFAPSGGRALLAKVRTSAGDDGYRLFTDNGFLKTAAGEITSLNLSHYPAEVRTAMIAEVDFGNQGAAAAFSLSNDGVTWERAAVGETVTFRNRGGRMLFWRAEFAPDANRDATPFLDRIEIFFRVRFL